mmetsp:Transcript_3287/g.9366  ORF Transcript_3287/g.9366 Transcript_3287/m.9366 type:complete len:336 (+) Transcript_3287:565-1572(+)
MHSTKHSWSTAPPQRLTSTRVASGTGGAALAGAGSTSVGFAGAGRAAGGATTAGDGVAGVAEAADAFHFSTATPSARRDPTGTPISTRSASRSDASTSGVHTSCRSRRSPSARLLDGSSWSASCSSTQIAILESGASLSVEAAAGGVAAAGDATTEAATSASSVGVKTESERYVMLLASSCMTTITVGPGTMVHATISPTHGPCSITSSSSNMLRSPARSSSPGGAPASPTPWITNWMPWVKPEAMAGLVVVEVGAAKVMRLPTAKSRVKLACFSCSAGLPSMLTPRYATPSKRYTGTITRQRHATVSSLSSGRWCVSADSLRTPCTLSGKVRTA